VKVRKSTGKAQSPLRAASAIVVSRAYVTECLDLKAELDRRFATAWRRGLGALPVRLRSGALPGVTGHLAESVVELILVDRGYVPVAHHPGPGRHGVDLLMLNLEHEMVFAIEVKGTLRPGRIPRLSRGELGQMTGAWVDKPDNPAMSGADLASADVFGGVAAVNFADMTLRMSLTTDFTYFHPVTTLAQLDDPSWLVDSHSAT
jgi:hypothetical protein